MSTKTYKLTSGELIKYFDNALEAADYKMFSLATAEEAEAATIEEVEVVEPKKAGKTK